MQGGVIRNGYVLPSAFCPQDENLSLDSCLRTQKEMKVHLVQHSLQEFQQTASTAVRLPLPTAASLFKRNVRRSLLDQS